jgi:hypothetical protein
MLLGNARYYLGSASILAAIAAVAAFAIFSAKRLRFWKGHYYERLSLYVAWFLAAGVVALATPVYDPRYILFALPPAIVIAFDIVALAFSAFASRRFVNAALLIVAATVTVRQLATAHPGYVTGMRPVAEQVHHMGYSRVLYCGIAGGSFIFDLRAVSGRNAPTVIRCDKLPAQILEGDVMRGLAGRHGVRAIVLEQEFEPAVPWGSVISHPPPSMVFERRWPVAGSEFHGSILLYRVLDPSTRPEPLPPIEIKTFGRTLDGN